MLNEIYLLLPIALGLGLLHALDADHIAAVTALSTSAESKNDSLRYALQWSAGHAALLIIMASAYFFIGSQWSILFSEIAERLVGVVLVVLGLSILYKSFKQKLSLHHHQHDGYHAHTHWIDGQDETHHNKANRQNKHRATLVGGLHGMAGSAPVIISLPIIQSGNLAALLTYISIFSIGVFIAMVAFGGLLKFSLKKLADKTKKYYQYLQVSIALIAMTVGVKLVITS